MRVFKIFFSATIILILLLFSFVTNTRSKGFDPEETLFSETIGCGYANTEFNKCCKTSSGFLENIEEEELNSTISKLKACHPQDQNLNNCFSDRDADIILTLITMSPKLPLGDNESLLGALVDGYLISSDSNRESEQGTSSFSTMETIMRSLTNQYNNLSRNDKLKLFLKTSIAQKEDKCLANIGPAHGFCVQDAAGYAIDIAGDNQDIQAYLEAQGDITGDECIYGTPDTKGGSCTCKAETGLSKLCVDYITDTNVYEKCADCVENGGGFWTGFGCIGLSFQGFVKETLFGWGLGLAGIITLLCIIYAAFMLQTSAGNPEKIKKAREYLTACITGLLLIVFSILILRIIGVDILKIPGFN